eukprot:gene6892-9444_t
MTDDLDDIGKLYTEDEETEHNTTMLITEPDKFFRSDSNEANSEIAINEYCSEEDSDENNLWTKDFADICYLLQEKACSVLFNGEISLQDKFLEFIHHIQYKEHHNESLGKESKIEKIFGYIKSNNKSGLNAFLENNREEIKDTDAAGANIIHLAYLFEMYDLGHWLVENYGDLALQPYSAKLPKRIDKQLLEKAKRDNIEFIMPYAGENILHMVIIRRKYEEVNWLLTHYRNHSGEYPDGLRTLLMQPVTGYMFQNRKEAFFYFGKYPLHFAACSNDTDIFDLVFRYTSCIDLTATNATDHPPASSSRRPSLPRSSLSNHARKKMFRISSEGPHSIFLRDDVGNTTLHLCVMHGLPKMFEHVLKTAAIVLHSEIKQSALSKYKEKEKKEKGNENMSLSFDLTKLDEKYLLPGIGLLPIETTVNPPENFNSKFFDWLKIEINLKLGERLLNVLNKDLHSPLTLAAVLTKKTDGIHMLETVINSNLTVHWKYGPKRCTNVNLEGLDIAYDIENGYQFVGCKDEETKIIKIKQIKTKMKSAIQWMCYNKCYDSLKIPVVKSLIENKWEKCGCPNLKLSFCFNIATTFLITLLLIFSNQSPAVVNISHNKYRNEEAFASFLYFILFCVYGIRFMGQVYYIHRYGFEVIKRIFQSVGIAFFDNLFQTLKTSSFLLTFAFKLHQSHANGGNKYFHSDGSFRTEYAGYKITLAICVLVSYIHMYYFLMAFDGTGPFVLSISKVAGYDVPYFQLFYSILVIGFGCALSLLSNNGNPKAYYGFWHLLKAIYTLIQRTVNLDPTHDEIGIDHVYIETRWLSDLLITIYYIIVVILMLNLLLAMIANTLKKYTDSNAEILLAEKHNIMESMEQNLNFTSPSITKRHRHKYCRMEPIESNKITSTGSSAYQHNFKLFEEISDWHLHETPKKEEKFMLFIVNPDKSLLSGGELVSKLSDARETTEKITHLIDKLGHKITDIFVSVDDQKIENGLNKNIIFASNEEEKANEESNNQISSISIRSEDNITYQLSNNANLSSCLDEWVVDVNEEHNKDNNSITINDCKFSIKLTEDVNNQPSNKDFTSHPNNEEKVELNKEHNKDNLITSKVVTTPLKKWEVNHRPVEIIQKNQHAKSVFSDFPYHPYSGFNYDLLSILQTGDKLLICGQSNSQGFNYALEDIMSKWYGDTSRIVFLEDCTIPSDEKNKNLSLKCDAVQYGVTVTTSDQFLSSIFPSNE